MLRRFQTVINLVALAVIIFFTVDFFYLIIRVKLNKIDTQEHMVHHVPNTKAHEKHTLDYYESIIDRNIFSSGKGVPQEIREEKVEALEPTSLKIALLGTVVGDEHNSIAIIEERDKKKQDLYRVGDSIQDAIIKKILRGKVILKVNDGNKVLTIEEHATTGARSEELVSEQRERGEVITVSRSEVEHSLENIHQILSQARVRPHFTGGKADGLAITRIRAGSIFSKLGLKNGDIVQGIDGRDIRSPEDVLEIYNKLRSGSGVEVEIKRKGEQKLLNYQFQ